MGRTVDGRPSAEVCAGPLILGPLILGLRVTLRLDLLSTGANRYDLLTMGQPVTVIEKPTGTPGIVRYEINRSITGMDHEVYVEGDEIFGDRPPDVLARRLFEWGGVSRVSMYSNIITVELSQTNSDGIKKIVEDLFIYYRPGVEVPSVEG